MTTNKGSFKNNGKRGAKGGRRERGHGGTLCTRRVAEGEKGTRESECKTRHGTKKHDYKRGGWKAPGHRSPGEIRTGYG